VLMIKSLVILWNCNLIHTDTDKSVEFYDFLQVNASSSDTKCGSSLEEQDEDRDDQAEGQAPFIDFLKVGASHHRQ
jgi:transcription factor MYB, plant